jgi:hypothetical protein
MFKVENSDVITHVLSSLINVSSTKTSKAHAWLTMRTLLKNLEDNYNFLKYIEIDELKYFENNLNVVNITSDINYVESKEVGKAIQNLVEILKSHLGKKASYFFIREFREDLGEDYHSLIKNMGVDLRLVELQDELFNWNSENYKIRDDSNANIAFLEKRDEYT